MGSEGDSVNVDEVVFGDYFGKTLHVEAQVLIEVAPEDDLVAFVESGLKKRIERSAELSAGVLVFNAISLKLEDLLGMSSGDAGGAGVGDSLVCRDDGYVAAHATEEGEGAEVSHGIRILGYDLTCGVAGYSKESASRLAGAAEADLAA